MNAQQIFTAAFNSINPQNPENFKWATFNGSINAPVQMAAFLAVEDAIHSTQLTHREKRALITEIKEFAGITGHEKYEAFNFLMKNEIAEINKIVLAAI